MPLHAQSVSLKDIEAAHERIKTSVMRTPLVPLNIEDSKRKGLAWNAKQLSLPCQIVMPDHAPESKIRPTLAMGATVTKVPFDQWWDVLVHKKYKDFNGTFIHPVSEPSVIAGNGTIGLEILDDLPEVDSIVVPYGGGGLSSGIALAARA
uniref:Tryptophan synthase beta chain-like PALP domain-containing protein n=1 Tax=Arion vulgaris TaxID=1028688 RepID=A0A0B7ASF8_9EUPU